MERRAFFMSVGLSLFAMWMVWNYVSGKDQEMEREFGNFTTMVVATRDILQYETVRPTDVQTVRVPAAMVPPGIVRDPKDVYDAIAAIPITKGEHILDNKVISRNIYSGLDSQVALGKRAISIPVNVRNSIGYMIRPGNRVDLAAHFEYKAAIAISEVKVFLQDVLVLATGRTIQTAPPRAVDQDIMRGVMGISDMTKTVDDAELRETLNFAKTDPNYMTLTLEVTPTQAQNLVYVHQVFQDIYCMLRHADDRQLQRVGTTNLLDVMGPDSFLGRGPKAQPPRAIPRVKFFDLVGGDQVPVAQ